MNAQLDLEKRKKKKLMSKLAKNNNKVRIRD
jgi:hypothetical protein